MGPYTKSQTSTAIEDGWEITDGDDAVIAHLDTETMTNAMLAVLLGDISAEGVKDYEANTPYGDDETDEEDDKE